VFTSITSFASSTPHARVPAKARTILGWTPGLRHLVSGSVLSCGCLAGTYETWTGEAVTIVDARGSACRDDRHQTDAIL
jgi:hypothetical protein